MSLCSLISNIFRSPALPLTICDSPPWEGLGNTAKAVLVAKRLRACGVQAVEVRGPSSASN